MNNDRFKFRVVIKQPDGSYKRYPVLEMVFGEPVSVIYNDGSKEFPYGRDIDIDGDNAILEQCAGKPDKHGQLIHEGDMVRVYDLSGDVFKEGVVRWRGTAFGIVNENAQKGWACPCLPVDLEDELFIGEIVGSTEEADHE